MLASIASNGDGDLVIMGPDREVGSPASQLMSDPALRRLFDETTRLRISTVGPTPKFQCNIPIRHGIAPKLRSNLFHYDPTVVTMVIPIFIPHATVGNCGELVAFGNKRPFRRFVATHLIESVLTHNSPYRRRFIKKVRNAPAKYIVELQPGDAYVFGAIASFTAI